MSTNQYEKGLPTDADKNYMTKHKMNIKTSRLEEGLPTATNKILQYSLYKFRRV